jgi:hypothetical protein
MFKRIRIAVLLYALVFALLGNYLTARRSTDWDAELWVDVYPVNGDGSAAVATYVEGVDLRSFEPVEAFLADQARRHGLGLKRPFRLNLAPPLDESLPPVPKPGILGAVAYSLSMRLTTMRLNWSSDRPTPDIVLFVVYHDPATTALIERSGALRKGMIATANVFADDAMRGSNTVVIAHELLHMLGATDKYDPRTGYPTFPDGFAEPARRPRLPQTKAELMAGRIPLGPGDAEIPTTLRDVVIGPATAAEIGWPEASTTGQIADGTL